MSAKKRAFASIQRAQKRHKLPFIYLLDRPRPTSQGRGRRLEPNRVELPNVRLQLTLNDQDRLGLSTESIAFLVPFAAIEKANVVVNDGDHVEYKGKLYIIHKAEFADAADATMVLYLNPGGRR